MSGLEHRFNVYRQTDNVEKQRKHSNCFYFVLDVTHDINAIPALLAYANACEETEPELAADLRAKAQDASDRLDMSPEW